MNPLFKLLAKNRGKGDFRSEKSTTADEATIYLYDVIVDSVEEKECFGGVAPLEFIEMLSQLKVETIHLRVNSPGGSVFGARAMEQAIRECSSKVIAHIDGLAASAASFLVTAADNIIMAPGSFLMIHKAWMLTMGNADDLTGVASVLRQIDGSLAKTYSDHTGISVDEITAMMAAETWIDADQAVELKFANSVAESKAKNMARQWDLSAYGKAPAQIEQTPPLPDAAQLNAREYASRLANYYQRIAR